ncbi:GNAT family N-acetyltransferase [Nonomuraea longispora]|uniref:GNAT family N-acetyltransferase n=1 Tax=Nonomuraea longispora TaxID=1848320 RepID=A0A4R4MZC7_9ACTN|nr:GNAT family N-acetyltransferase [Nonomuraea longispora]TDB99726.1 GNAT family N-acetyltransferase [Nonomuraea longispora]
MDVLTGAAPADLARAIGFVHAFARRRAPIALPVPGGFAVLDDRFPGSYDDNKLIVGSGGPSAGELLRAADDVLAGRAHRLVCVDDDRLGAALAPAFAAAGYEHETNLIMAYRGEVPHDPPPADRLELPELLPVLRRDWRQVMPQAPDDVIDGLARRVERRLRGADLVGFRAVRAGDGPDGEIAARADLYVDGGIAQIESVFTSMPHRGKGHARALMAALLAEAAEAELIFLVADADDWPKDFYGRLGFEPLGSTHAFLRA